MYRGTYIDAMGRKRREMGYFSLNKPTLNKLHIPVIVQARDNYLLKIGAFEEVELK